MRAVVDENGLADEEDTHREQLNKKDRTELISNSLKKLENVKKQRMNAFILKDTPGNDGEFSLQGIKLFHLKTMKGKRIKINSVYRAVKRFRRKMAI